LLNRLFRSIITNLIWLLNYMSPWTAWIYHHTWMLLRTATLCWYLSLIVLLIHCFWFEFSWIKILYWTIRYFCFLWNMPLFMLSISWFGHKMANLNSRRCSRWFLALLLSLFIFLFIWSTHMIIPKDHYCRQCDNSKDLCWENRISEWIIKIRNYCLDWLIFLLCLITFHFFFSESFKQ